MKKKWRRNEEEMRKKEEGRGNKNKNNKKKNKSNNKNSKKNKKKKQKQKQEPRKTHSGEHFVAPVCGGFKLNTTHKKLDHGLSQSAKNLFRLWCNGGTSQGFMGSSAGRKLKTNPC